MSLKTLAAALLLAALPAFGQTSDDTLYRQLGGQDGLVRLMDDFMQRLLADRRMQPFFKDVNQQHVKEQLVAQFCEVSGGPCKLNGPDMKRVHENLDIARADFNALVEVLQLAMDAQGIPFGAQNRLLAQLAPMHRDIVNVK
ncbi:MAG TPA: group 1 truncated hemoglobin [Albitalea sp.]|uniref:group I truncated hemoglobin n=1 Tax=Piscinibacter sp. TaxID=1903157 RepID=UPI002ED03292